MASLEERLELLETNNSYVEKLMAYMPKLPDLEEI